jgi:Copper type II ascorbate-dependent monooxygenase, C-terminal domain
VAGGSQTANGAPIVNDLPPDVAVKIPGGTVLLMNTHYLNAGAQPLATDARINLFTVPAEQAKREAGFVFFYNPFIRVPAKRSAQAREVCPVRSDISLVNVQSHMHKRGVGFEAQLLDATGNPIEELYRGTEWQEVVMKKNTPHKALKAGQLIDYRCQYDNPESRVITQGLSTRDEMCMLVGLYYPRDRQFELCGINETWDGSFFGARWIGNGDVAGDQTLSCLMQARSAEDDKGDSLFGCVTDSCPKITVEVSNAVRCLSTRASASCEEECKAGKDACQQCYMPKCRPMLDALAVATCN